MRPNLLGLPVLAAAALLFLACDGGRPSYEPSPKPDVAVPPGVQRIELAMGDFCFYPSELHLPAGQTVQLAVRNLGNIRHELMAGRELGGHGYERDFFAGLNVQAAGDPREYQWAAEEEDGHGHGGDAPESWSPEGEVRDCPGQVMMRADGVNFDQHAHMPGAGSEHPGSMDGGGPIDEENGTALAGEDEDAHSGDEAAHQHSGELWELNVDAGGVAYLTFTVPKDAKGEWEIGCFIPRHYERNMAAKFVVE
jgi:uncharacterized cupredoxin-like copper-binding protein